MWLHTALLSLCASSTARALPGLRVCSWECKQRLLEECWAAGRAVPGLQLGVRNGLAFGSSVPVAGQEEGILKLVQNGSVTNIVSINSAQ